MSERVYVLGVNARATAFALRLRQSTHVTVMADAADDLASFNGATILDGANEGEQRGIQSLIAAADPSLSFTASRVVTALGVVRHVGVRPTSALELSRASHVICVGFNGWREWSAQIVAAGLEKAGTPAEVVNVQLHGASPDASWHQMRTRLQDVTFRDEIVRALKMRLVDGALVLMPPMLGVSSTGLPLAQALGNELGIDASRIGEAVATAPTLFGEAHRDRVLAHLQAKEPSGSLGAELEKARAYVFTSRAKVWTTGLEKVVYRMDRQSVGAGWLAGYRDAVALEAQWAQ